MGFILTFVAVVAVVVYCVRLYFLTPSTKETLVSLELAGHRLTLFQMVRPGDEDSHDARPPDLTGDSPVCGPDEGVSPGASPPERG